MLAGCSSDKDPTGVTSGSFSFNFAGGISGTFTASGSFPTNSSQLPTTTWAAGEVSTADGGTYVAAATPNTSTTHNIATFFAERTTAGTATISTSCSSNCADFVFLFGAHNTSTSTSPVQTCFMTTGTVTFTTLSSSRAIGSFSGTGSCISAGGATTSFTVSNGTFDVALVSGVA